MKNRLTGFVLGTGFAALFDVAREVLEHSTGNAQSTLRSGVVVMALCAGVVIVVGILISRGD